MNLRCSHNKGYVMLLPEKSQLVGHQYDPSKEEEIWGYGEAIRKASHLLKDSDEKWKILCQITDIQTSTKWASKDAYHSAIKRVDKQLGDHIQVNPDPFIL